MFRSKIVRVIFYVLIIFAPLLIFGCLVIGKIPHIKIGGISISDPDSTECVPPQTITDKEYDGADLNEIDKNAPTGLTLEQIQKYFELYRIKE